MHKMRSSLLIRKLLPCMPQPSGLVPLGCIPSYSYNYCFRQRTVILLVNPPLVMRKLLPCMPQPSGMVPPRRVFPATSTTTIFGKGRMPFVPLPPHLSCTTRSSERPARMQSLQQENTLRDEEQQLIHFKVPHNLLSTASEGIWAGIDVACLTCL